MVRTLRSAVGDHLRRHHKGVLVEVETDEHSDGGHRDECRDTGESHEDNQGERVPKGHGAAPEVVAEGAESYEQIAFLKENNCQQVQGFYYSPAIPLQQMPRFVEQLRQKRQESLFS